MNTIILRAFAGILTLTGAVGNEKASASEAPPFNPDLLAAAVAPYVDEQTIVVAHADLDRVQVDALADKWIELVPDAKRDAEDLRGALKQIQTALLGAGFHEAFVVASLADVPVSPPLVVLPKSRGADFARLKDAIFGVAALKTLAVELQERPGAVVWASDRTLRRLGDMSAEPRQALADAFLAAGDHATQILMLPTDDDRRVIEELMPKLPEDLGGGPSTILTHGVEWAALGLDASPKPTIDVTIQSVDNKAAEEFQKTWQLGVAALASGVLRQTSAEVASKPTVPEQQRLAGALAAALTPAVHGERLTLRLADDDGSMKKMLDAAASPVRELALQGRRERSADNIKQLTLAILNFESAKDRFPAIGTFDAGGKPLLSWRVHILPYMEEMALYRQFHLDEPWDSPHNRELIPKMPEIFRCPASKHRASDGLATYREIAAEHTVFPGQEAIEFKQITDGSSNTILLAEVDDDHAVVWTKPEGLPYKAENPAEGLGGQFPGGIGAGFCDGHYKFIPLPFDPEQLRRLILRDDNQPITWP